MADAPLTYGTVRPGASWSSIFAGTFVFLAIEVTFGFLGTAIFASSANPSAAHPVSGMSAGIGVWMTVLSIIALYFGGRAAGHLSYAATRLNGMYHGLVTFGLSIFATVLILALALGTTSLGATNPANVSRSWALDIAAKGGWYIFVALILGGIAAAIGGAHSTRRRVVPSVSERTPTTMRPAA